MLSLLRRHPMLQSNAINAMQMQYPKEEKEIHASQKCHQKSKSKRQSQCIARSLAVVKKGMSANHRPSFMVHLFSLSMLCHAMLCENLQQ
jgi:hypothetical protein